MGKFLNQNEQCSYIGFPCEHKSEMIIPRYANTGVLCAGGTCLAPTEAERRKDCGSATHGTIRRHHSWGLLTPTS